MSAKKSTTPKRKTVKPPAASAAIKIAAAVPVEMMIAPATPVKPVVVEIAAIVKAEPTPAVEALTAVAEPIVEAAVEAAVEADLIPMMIAQLHGSDADAAVDAAAALAAAQTAVARDALIHVLTDTTGYYHIVTRAASALALGHFNDEAAIAALHLAAQDDTSAVSSEAILSLGQVKASASTSLLMRIAANPTGFYLQSTRHAAVRALGAIKAEEARSLLSMIAADCNEQSSLSTAADEALRAL
ncbi:MAG TPA: HEAT repeat domain-containing protein [Tepidisphaeraceae bacterium]|jgi:HEAT repeat protein